MHLQFEKNLKTKQMYHWYQEISKRLTKILYYKYYYPTLRILYKR